MVWIDVNHPSQWDKTVYDQLAEAWRSSEGIGYYYEEKPTVDVDLIQAVTDTIKTIPNTHKNQEEIDALQRKIDSLKKVDD